MRNFLIDRECILTEYSHVKFEGKEQFMDQLEEYMVHMSALLEEESAAVYAAHVFRFIAEYAPLAADPHNMFQDKIFHGDVLLKLRGKRIRKMREAFPADTALVDDWDRYGVNGVPSYDFGHSCMDMAALLTLGLPGIIERLVKAKEKLGNAITKEQEYFYQSCIITYSPIGNMVAP